MQLWEETTCTQMCNTVIMKPGIPTYTTLTPQIYIPDAVIKTGMLTKRLHVCQYDSFSRWEKSSSLWTWCLCVCVCVCARACVRECVCMCVCTHSCRQRTTSNIVHLKPSTLCVWEKTRGLSLTWPHQVGQASSRDPTIPPSPTLDYKYLPPCCPFSMRILGSKSALCA